MKRSWIILIVVGLVLILAYSSVRNSYNTMVSRQEMVSGQWAQVENVYQRRADLIPNLVSTVRGYADFEQQTLTQVIEARSKATSIDIDAGELTPQAMERFEAAQAGLSSALSRLLVTVERYPELKANQNFLELQAQLEGTENRISSERRKYNEVTRDYNAFIKRFPTVMFANLFGFGEKPYFEAEAGAEQPPAVEF